MTTFTRTQWQFVGDTLLNSWETEVFQRDLQNKSKAVWAFDSENTKSRLSFHADYRHLVPRAINREGAQGLLYDFRKQQTVISLLPTLFYERLFNEKWAIQLKAAYVYRNQSFDNRLMHNDSLYGEYLQAPAGEPLSDFRQTRTYGQEAWRASFLTQYTSAVLGSFQLGGLWEDARLSAEKEAAFFRADQWQPAPYHRFSGNTSGLYSWAFKPFVSHDIMIAGVWLSHKWAWAYMVYPTLLQEKSAQKQRLEYDLKLSTELLG